MQTTCITDRLILNILHPIDADKVLLFYDKNKEHFEPWEPERDPNFYTLSYQRLTLSIENNLISQSKILRYWVFLRDNPNEIIGTVNFYNILRSSYCSCQLGYKFDRDYTGFGYAYESIREAIKVILYDYQLHRIEANIMPSNTPSINLINKLGFSYEGLAKSSIHINHKWEDHARYAYINPEY
jgi:[ribosomal protein S5]-alanine N-acetyltransferase